MPLGLDPDATADAWLKSDEGKPADVRPTFLLRFLTARQREKFIALCAAAQREGSPPDETRRNRQDAIRVALAGWRNMRTANADILEAFELPPDPSGKPVDLPYRPELLSAVLTVAEQWELVGLIPERVLASENDRFTSPSQSPGSAAASAASAGAESATRNPPSPSPSSSAEPVPPATGSPPPARRVRRARAGASAS